MNGKEINLSVIVIVAALVIFIFSFLRNCSGSV